MDYHTQTEAMGREIFPDLVRSFAILGIVVVNVAFFAWPGEAGYSDGGITGAADQAAYFGVNAIALMKSYSLFSMMFGVGLAYQMASAKRRGADFAPRYFRRMAGLLVLGLAHVFFAFTGDILIIYAVFGCFLYLFRFTHSDKLRRIGTGFIVAQVVVMALFALATFALMLAPPDIVAEIDAEMSAMTPETYAAYRQESFLAVGLHRLSEYGEYVGFILPIQGLAVFGYFLWGLAAAKSRAIADPTRPGWARARRVALPLGLGISAFGAALMVQADTLFSWQSGVGNFLIALGAPLSTLGYLGLIAKWAECPPSALKTFMARGGTSTLTAYLLQSLILSWIFSGYGLGLYGTLGAAPCIAIALATGLLTLIVTSLIRTRFQRGPFEWLLRKWTYLGAR